LKAGEWFRRGRLFMVSPARGDYRRCQAEIPLIVLCRFPGPALLEAALRPFFKLRATMPLQYITAFLLVALKEGQTVTELADRAGISPSLMTRHLADLGQMNRYHKDGYDLVESELDPMDRRTKRQRLTAKGQRLVGHLLGALTR
jgi:DNA-binding MarR family transcriptional regulator